MSLITKTPEVILLSSPLATMRANALSIDERGCLLEVILRISAVLKSFPGGVEAMNLFISLVAFGIAGSPKKVVPIFLINGLGLEKVQYIRGLPVRIH
jgi:hypothetical protein